MPSLTLFYLLSILCCWANLLHDYDLSSALLIGLGARFCERMNVLLDLAWEIARGGELLQIHFVVTCALVVIGICYGILEGAMCQVEGV